MLTVACWVIHCWQQVQHAGAGSEARRRRVLTGDADTNPPAPASYALLTCHAALGRAASAFRGAGFPWRRLPACVEVFLSTAVRYWPWPLVRRHEPGTTKRLRTGSSCMPDRLDDRHEHIQHPRDQDGQRYATRRIVSTAGAAAWLPHSKLCDTRITSGYGNPSSPAVPARLERRTTTGPVVHNSTHGDHAC